MTFDEYNTDEYFKNSASSADGLIKKAKEEGKTREEVESSLSPLWKEDKKGNVKKALDTYYKTEEKKEAPKKEPSADDAVGLKTLGAINGGVAAPVSNPPEKKAEETPETKDEVVESVIEQTAPNLENEDTGIKQSDKKYMNEVNAILNEQQKEELKKLSKTSLDAYNRTMSNMERSGDSFKKIDDKLIEQLPTFMFKRYQNGEFGDPKSGDAKLRLAYFAINNVVSKFKQIANADAISRGKGAIFENTESAYDKYQKSNLEQGLENRWSKYKQETQAAIDMVKNRNVSEEEALNIINKISMNNRLQNAYNMADENKKAYMIEVLSKVGDKVSNWNDQKFINALIGAEITGEPVDNAVALIGSRAGMKIGEQLNIIDENGNLDISALQSMINIPGFTDMFKAQFGFDPNNLINGSGDNSEENPDSVINEKETGNKWKNPTGNVKGYKALDGNTYDFNTFETKDGKQKLISLVNDLDDRFYNGEIDAATYRKYREPLYKEIGKHIGVKASTTDDALKANVKKKLKDLNKETGNGSVTVDGYKEQIDKILAMAKDVGMSDKEINALKKDFKDTKKIKYKGPKK